MHERLPLYTHILEIPFYTKDVFHFTLVKGIASSSKMHDSRQKVLQLSNLLKQCVVFEACRIGRLGENSQNFGLFSLWLTALCLSVGLHAWWRRVLSAACLPRKQHIAVCAWAGRQAGEIASIPLTRLRKPYLAETLPVNRRLAHTDTRSYLPPLAAPTPANFFRVSLYFGTVQHTAHIHWPILVL